MKLSVIFFFFYEIDAGWSVVIMSYEPKVAEKPHLVSA